MEEDYLRALADTVSLDDWQQVVCTAVTQAKKGDAKARDWLAKYLLGEVQTTLTILAEQEQPPELITSTGPDVSQLVEALDVLRDAGVLPQDSQSFLQDAREHCAADAPTSAPPLLALAADE